MKYTYCGSIRKNQCVDKNGNNEAVENLNNNNFFHGSTRELTSVDGDDENVKPKNQIDKKPISRLEAMAISDDDDYGKNFFMFICFDFYDVLSARWGFSDILE